MRVALLSFPIVDSRLGIGGDTDATRHLGVLLVGTRGILQSLTR